MATKKIVPAPAAPLPMKSVTAGRFTFAAKIAEVIPDIPKTHSTNPLAFAALFTDDMPNRYEGWVPEDYWTAPVSEGGRAADPEKVTMAYQKDRIRTVFKKWVSDNEARKRFSLLLFYRDGTMDAENHPEKGISWFVLDSTAK